MPRIGKSSNILLGIAGDHQQDHDGIHRGEYVPIVLTSFNVLGSDADLHTYEEDVGGVSYCYKKH